jgi:hypothetical protein
VSRRAITETRPILLVLFSALTIMGHAIRTGPSSLPAPDLWWVLFAIASWSALFVAVAPNRRRVQVVGALTVTVFVSRALAIGVQWVTEGQMPRNPLLGATVWLTLAYLSGMVFAKLPNR